MRIAEILQENYQTLRQSYELAKNEKTEVLSWFLKTQPAKADFYNLHFRNAVDAFEYLVKNNLILDTSTKKSTQFWISEIKKDSDAIFEFTEYVLMQLDRLYRARQQKASEKNYSVIYKDSGVTVYKPHSHAASTILGKSTKWCTTSKCSSASYDLFSRNGSLFYLHVKGQQSPNHKLAVYVNHDLRAMDMLNAADKHISRDQFSQILADAGADVSQVIRSIEDEIPSGDIEHELPIDDNSEFDTSDFDVTPGELEYIFGRASN